jgi:PIN domain nuclease of toxin-antitoxin system
VDLVLAAGGAAIYSTASAKVILLDTNAIIWLHRGARRVRALEKATSLYASPASLLELQFLIEVGRLRLRSDATVDDLVADDRWLLDDPPSAMWFSQAVEVDWTRDPFDRLIVAHAGLRGWRLATGDTALASRLGPQKTFEL